VGMILVPAGTFNMGSTAFPDTQPVHPVTLAAFYIDQFEVVNDLYHQCVAASACTDPGKRNSDTRSSYYDDPAFGSFPVNNVTWQQSVNFCQWQQKRLPTEAEWEYAAVGTDGRAYPWGGSFDTSLVPASADDTVQVGSIPGNASPFGAEDMSGNVLEWTADWYAPDFYAASPSSNPTGPASGDRKVMRGGAFGNPDPTIYLSARRFSRPPNSGDVDIGFRCVMTAPK
jgi:formylglycine-generating enzyme required for sulfatase activity